MERSDFDSIAGLGGVLPSEYAGHCRRCDAVHRFENDTTTAIGLLSSLFREIASSPAHAALRRAIESDGGKMVGVLLCETPAGERRELRAYSGEVGKRTDWPGFVGPVIGRAPTLEHEAAIQPKLRELTREIDALPVDALRSAFERTKADAVAEARDRRARRGEARQARGLARRAGVDASILEAQAAETKRIEDANETLANAKIAAALGEYEAVLARRRALSDVRRGVSQALWEEMLDHAKLANARGELVPIREVLGRDGGPGGTADCVVPRLLHAANVLQFRPIAIAEAWWGPSLNGRHHGELQPPCDAKCKPILGHLLCGSGSP